MDFCAACARGGDRVLVGERNRLLVVDLSIARTTESCTTIGSITTIGSFALAESPSESVYAIAPLPAGFESLPPRAAPSISPPASSKPAGRSERNTPKSKK